VKPFSSTAEPLAWFPVTVNIVVVPVPGSAVIKPARSGGEVKPKDNAITEAINALRIQVYLCFWNCPALELSAAHVGAFS
jgi:hypothetical protein